MTKPFENLLQQVHNDPNVGPNNRVALEEFLTNETPGSCPVSYTHLRAHET